MYSYSTLFTQYRRKYVQYVYACEIESSRCDRRGRHAGFLSCRWPTENRARASRRVHEFVVQSGEREGTSEKGRGHSYSKRLVSSPLLSSPQLPSPLGPLVLCLASTGSRRRGTRARNASELIVRAARRKRARVHLPAGTRCS